MPPTDVLSCGNPNAVALNCKKGDPELTNGHHEECFLLIEQRDFVLS